MLSINGAYGEGGGQIIRSALTLATILGQPIHLTNIRAGRKNPGLSAQHLMAVQAAGLICAADISGAELGSTEITFVPQSEPIPGIYEFDVAEMRTGGSAGATTLVLQTILLPLALATEASKITIKGGTHVAWSPPFHYIKNVFLPMLSQLGVQVEATLQTWGWYPAGQGEIELHIPGQAKLQVVDPQQWLQRRALIAIDGIGVAANLPAHIAQRMVDRAERLLHQTGVAITIEPQRVRSISSGAGIFLVAEYENCYVGFSNLGRRGKPSEQVAEEVVQQFWEFHNTEAVLDEHLADQLILPLSLTKQASTVSCSALSLHTTTNLWLVEQFLGPFATIDQENNVIQFFS